jgi:hypothetical protein
MNRTTICMTQPTGQILVYVQLPAWRGRAGFVRR